MQGIESFELAFFYRWAHGAMADCLQRRTLRNLPRAAEAGRYQGGR